MHSRAGIQSPEFHPFWQDFSDRLRVVARRYFRDCKLPLQCDPDDLAQQGLIAAFEVISARLTGRVATLRLLEDSRAEAFRVAQKTLKNDFLDEVRRVLRQNGLLAVHTRGSTEREGSVGIVRNRIVTPEETLAADKLVSLIQSVSRSQKNSRIAEALRTVVTRGSERVDGKEVTESAGVTSRDLADFRKMIRRKLNISARAAFEEVDDDLQQRH